MTNEVNKAIAAYLKSNNITAIDNEAAADNTYPYAVITSSRLNTNDSISSWTLEVNVWDKNKFYSRAETIADKIDKLLDFTQLKSGKNLICLFKAQKSNIADSDPAIKRVRIQFDMKIYESEM